MAAVVSQGPGPPSVEGGHFMQGEFADRAFGRCHILFQVRGLHVLLPEFPRGPILMKGEVRRVIVVLVQGIRQPSSARVIGTSARSAVLTCSTWSGLAWILAMMVSWVMKDTPWRDREA